MPGLGFLAIFWSSILKTSKPHLEVTLIREEFPALIFLEYLEGGGGRAIAQR